MNLFDKILGRAPETKSVNVMPTSGSTSARARYIGEIFSDLTRPLVVGSNFMTLFRTIPEVYWPIDYIASRIAGANYVVRRASDDSVVWRSSHPMNKILSNPNCLQGWQELVYQHFVYRLSTGNAYMRAAMGNTLSNANKFRMCKNFWSLPSEYVDIVPAYNGYDIPIFGIAELEDIIEGYRINYGSLSTLEIPAWQVWHDRDGEIDYVNGAGFLKAHSRLESLRKPISNLLAVYEARNIIYIKRGGLGFLVSQMQDEAGTVAMTPKQKQELLDQVNSYGVTEDKVSPIGVTSVPVKFERINMSISELQPFDETLLDAISIAAAYGIPSVLVPRKDQATFANQATAEKTVYHGMVIPTAKRFCKDLTAFLGLDESGYYLDCDFDEVDCLQTGRKEAEEVKKLVNDRCSAQFDKGLITLNDWRAQIGEDMVADDELPLFSKLKWQMTDEELNEVKRVFNNITENSSNNNNPSEDEQQRTTEGDALQDESV